MDWKGFSVPASACGNAECWLPPPPDTPPPPSPEFGSAGLAWGQLFAVSQMMLVAQGIHFENPLFQGTFLGTYWNTLIGIHRYPGTRGGQVAPLSEFLGVLKDVLAETPPGSLSWAPPMAAPAWDPSGEQGSCLWSLHPVPVSCKRAGTGPHTQAQRVGYLETPKGRLGPVSPTLGPSMQKPTSLASVMNRKGSDVGILPAAAV